MNLGKVLDDEIGAMLSLVLPQDGERASDVERQFAELRAHFNVATVEPCISFFVDAEMDFVTPGERGLGRLSSYVPRFGGYFRKRLSRLSADERQRLRDLMVRCLTSGYLACFVRFSRGVRPVLTDVSQLREKWISAIYSVNLDEVCAGLENIVLNLAAGPVGELKAAISRLELGRGSMLSSPKDPEKVDLILSHYPSAGCVLYLTENFSRG